MSTVSSIVETPGKISTVQVLGYPVANVSMEEAVEQVARFLEEPGLHHVIATNANKMWMASRVSGLAEVLRRAEMVIPEYAVVWGSRVLGRPLKQNIGGIRLLEALLPWLERQRVPAYFFGARREVNEVLIARLRRAYPALAVAGYRSGYFQLNEEEKIVRDINTSGAMVLFVGMGSPRQEFWIEKYRNELEPRVAMGVGGSFDVLAGFKRDAPPWMRHGGEWIYRLMQDPKNLWKRYLTTNPWFVCAILRERMLGPIT